MNRRRLLVSKPPSLASILIKALGQANLPVSSSRPLFDPSLVCGLIVESRNTFDTRPFTSTRGYSQTALKLGSSESVVDQTQSCSWSRWKGGWRCKQVVGCIKTSTRISLGYRYYPPRAHLSSSTSCSTLSSLAPTKIQTSSCPLFPLPAFDASRNPDPSSSRNR